MRVQGRFDEWPVNPQVSEPRGLSAKYVRHLDETTAVCLRCHHREVSRYVTGAATQHGSQHHAYWLQAEGQGRQ